MSQSEPPVVPPAAGVDQPARSPWVLGGGIVAIAGILSWVLASLTGSAVCYALVAIVAVGTGMFIRSRGGGRNRNRIR